ncbi:MAG: hypothetical protein KAS36_06410, partial [Anaerolineales bacterium]|nr:hypothetical protein [Anaerolineales bacterium]
KPQITFSKCRIGVFIFKLLSGICINISQNDIVAFFQFDYIFPVRAGQYIFAKLIPIIMCCLRKLLNQG